MAASAFVVAASGYTDAMYDFLRGRVAAIDATGHVSFDVNGVGYLLAISEQTRRRIPLGGEEVTLYARLIVREDDLLLYAFADIAERVAFDLLTSVQGVGPSVALAVLSALPADELRAVLVNRDAKALRQVKGVGAKTAERMALELADKIDRIPSGAPIPLPGERNAGAAPAPGSAAFRGLVALGFSAKEAEAALAAVVEGELADEDLLRAALAWLRG